MSNIPAARMRLLALKAEIDDILDLMVRPAPKRRAAISAPRCTPKMAAAVRKYAILHPKLPMRSIAARFKIDSGRVSEALRGLR
jgi:hypothetical protein